MTDREKGDHWGQLASVLGAEIHEEVPADEGQPSSPVSGQPPIANESPILEQAPVPRAEVGKPRRPRPSANWDALATSLGIEVPRKPEAEEVAVAPADRPRTRFAEDAEAQIGWQPPRPTMSPEQLAQTVEGLSESLKAAPAGLEYERVPLIGHETVAVTVDGGGGDVEEADRLDGGEEPARGRSKRRRRRRPRAGERQAVQEDSEAVPSETAKTADATGEEGEHAASESEEKRRSKRRRPRRRRQKSDITDAKAGPQEEAADDANGDTDAADDDDADDTRDFGDGEGIGDKAGHRSIPVWQEAISVIVEKNMESRAKKPDGGGQQKRGGRRSGRRGRG